jgi:excisionase family DNA binding protein
VNAEIMTIQELAAYLQIGADKLYKLAQTGKIPAAKVGRTWRFRKDLIDDWFLENTGTISYRDHQNPQPMSIEKEEKLIPFQE